MAETEESEIGAKKRGFASLDTSRVAWIPPRIPPNYFAARTQTLSKLAFVEPHYTRQSAWICKAPLGAPINAMTVATTIILTSANRFVD